MGKRVKVVLAVEKQEGDLVACIVPESSQVLISLLLHSLNLTSYLHAALPLLLDVALMTFLYVSIFGEFVSFKKDILSKHYTGSTIAQNS